MIQYFSTDRVILLPGIQSRELSPIQLDGYKKLFELGIFETPVGRLKDGYVQVASSCEFLQAVKQSPEIQEIQVDVRDFNDEQMVNVYEFTYPLQSPVENLTHQGVILRDHLALKNLNVSQVIKAFRSEGSSYTRQYAKLLTGFAQSPSWLQGVIRTYPRLKSLPSKLIPFASYTDFWSCLEDSFSTNAENLSKVTSRHLNQLLAFFKPMLHEGQEEEACRFLATSSLQDLIEKHTFPPAAASRAPSPICDDLEDDTFSGKSIFEEEVYSLPPTSNLQNSEEQDSFLPVLPPLIPSEPGNDLHDEELPQKSLGEQVLEEHVSKEEEVQEIHGFHFSRKTKKGFSLINETRGLYWNIVVATNGEIKPFYVGELLFRGVASTPALKEYLEQFSEYKELEADLFTLIATAPNNPYIKNGPQKSKPSSPPVPYKAQRISAHKGQITVDGSKGNHRSQLWSAFHAGIEDMNKLKEVEIQGITSEQAVALGLNIVDGRFLWFPSDPVSFPPLSEGVVYPKFLLCRSMDRTLITPDTPAKIVSFVPLESGPPAIECQFSDKNRVLPMNSLHIHSKDRLAIEQAAQNRARN